MDSPRRRKRSEDESTAPNVGSMKRNKSTTELINFGAGSSSQSEAESTAPTVISMKSNKSRGEPMNFKNESSSHSDDESMAPTLVSMKSDKSKGEPMNFKNESSSQSDDESIAPTVVSMKSDKSKGEPMNFRNESQSTGDQSEVVREPVKLGGGHWSYRLLEEKTNFKAAMRDKFAVTYEGNGDEPSPLDAIYTDVYITTGESAEPHAEHEFKDLEYKLKATESSEYTVSLSETFRSLTGPQKHLRTVLTKGVAGIGKSFTVHKFVLDWAEGKANKEFDFVFCLAFRVLNLSTGEKSLHHLLTELHPELTDSQDYVRTRVLVVLDGLDESRLQLDFNTNKTVKSVSDVTSVANLLTNLVQGNLLPDAKLWITSRPAAANQLPAKYVDMVTEIRGFSEGQKDKYFRKRFSENRGLADMITSHIKSSQSLDTMCHIPIFSWVSAVLFQEVFSGEEKAEAPQTLTEMMGRFLFVQTKRRSRNKERPLRRHREFLLKLGKLAFVHLQNNNLIFYEKDLEDYGIDTEEASIYSAFCTAVLREEKIFTQKKVVYFVHLTIQEFFAALYVYDCFTNKKTAELRDFLDLKDEEHTLVELLKMTVNKVLGKKNGHLEFFMRFLLGLVVESNRRVLQGLLTPPDPSQETDKKILTHLKSLRRKGLSPDSCVSLFQTMVEMRDHKVKDEIQEYLGLKDRSKPELTPLHCSAMAYMLQVSANHLEKLDLKSYNTSEEGRRRLIPAVRSSKKAILADCRVTPEWIEHLVSALKFPYSALRDLDLSNNDLKDSGVERLCEGLSSQSCRLEKLRLSGCQVTEMGCAFLDKALRSKTSQVTDLDLSYNHPRYSGVKSLSELRDNPQYKLNTLNLKHGGENRLVAGFKKYACDLRFDPNTVHRNLLLSEGNRRVTWVEEEQTYPHHLDRCDHSPQVLSGQGLQGERFYWEMEVLKPSCIGVTYKTKGLKGEASELGHNNKSWSLIFSDEGCFALHDNKMAPVPSLPLRSSRVGVYLDWPAGSLIFYKVSSDARSRLHTFDATFTEALYPAAELHTHSSVAFVTQPNVFCNQ